MGHPSLKVAWLDKPPERVYQQIAKATLNCHSKEKDPRIDMAKVDSLEPVEMWGMEFENGLALARFLTCYIRDLNHTAMLEFSGQFNFLVWDNSRGLTHEQVRQRIGVSYAQRSTRFVERGDYIVPYQLEPKDAVIWHNSLEDLEEKRKYFETKYPKDVTRHLLVIGTHSPIVIGYNNVVSIFHDLRLRCCYRAHWEIRFMANLIRELCRTVVPELFENAGAMCEQYGFCLEKDKQCPQRKGKIPTHEVLMRCWEENKDKYSKR